MRAWIEAEILYLHADDVPPYQKRGSIVRNSYFWALRSIAVRADFGKAWEFEAEVWYALQRMLTSFMDSGYLGTSETQLEFSEAATIPPVLQPMATWIAIAEFIAEPAPAPPEFPAFEDASEDGPEGRAADPSLEPEPRTSQSKSRWSRKSRDRPKPEDRPRPPYSSYI